MLNSDSLTYPIAALEVVDMVAQASGMGSDTGADAELAIRDEAGPVMVLKAGSERVSVYKAAN